MASVRTTRRPLGACVATVLAVTVGAGAFVAPGAVAAPATTNGVAAITAAVEASLPLGAEIVSTGDTGYLASRKDDSGTTVLEWHRFAEGSVVRVGTGTIGYDSNSDIAVTGDGISSVHLRDMTPGATEAASFNLATEFGPGAKLVGVAGKSLFVSVPTTSDYHELWQLSQVEGVTQRTRRSANAYSRDFKVISSTASELLVLGSNRVFPSSSTFRTEYWNALADLDGNGPLDGAGREFTGAWTSASTGAYTADFRAWTEYAGGAGKIVVTGQSPRKEFALDGSMSGTVIAGITGNTLLYGVPGKADDQTTPRPLHARTITTADGAPYKLLEHFSSVAHAPDGSLLVRGATADADGLFRISDGSGGIPSVTLVADTGRSLAVKVTESKVPTAVSLEKPGTTVPMEWTLSRPTATVDLVLTHTVTGTKLTKRLPQPPSGGRFVFTWDGVLGGVSAPNGAYTWTATATPTDGIGGPAIVSGSFQVTRQANGHDFSDNGSTDVLSRDATGVLQRDDLFDWPSGGRVTTAKRTALGSGWQIYNQIEAAGDLAGTPVGDLVARDTTGALWLYQGNGKGGFTSRSKIGSGWQIYQQIAGGSDLTGDGRPDLVATDTAGVAWLYQGTGSASAPFASRARIGGGWQVYNQITAVGDIAGSAAGDLVARDTTGVLWLYQGDGKGNFTSRVKIGAGWNAFSQLVGAGDTTGDGRPDLIAYGPNATYVYHSTGSTTAPFTRLTTTLYAGEGSKFNTIA
ncbi:FG-GAP repeat domain-containing protein [Streptomyces sp. NPDC059999]|uniref:FG-GAP repeat domain-containing protein n=1 Tax=Streptomyces sp. NPDC059999 TaxID=3347030 RepID=UPI0036AC6400